MSDINDKAFEHDIDSSDIIGSDLAMLTKGQLKDLEKKEKTEIKINEKKKNYILI